MATSPWPADLPHMISQESSTEGSEYEEVPRKAPETLDEDGIVKALGISLTDAPPKVKLEDNIDVISEEYDIVPDPDAEHADLSGLRGVKTSLTKETKREDKESASDEDLKALAELVPALKSRNGSAELADAIDESLDLKPKATVAEGGIELETPAAAASRNSESSPSKKTPQQMDSMSTEAPASQNPTRANQLAQENLAVPNEFAKVEEDDGGVSDSSVDVQDPVVGADEDDHDLGGFEDANSSDAIESDADRGEDRLGRDTKPYAPRNAAAAASASSDYQQMSSAASLSTATQTHEVRMPMYLPTFKPATGCTNASDFIVRCFVARLRSGITVVKHGRSRWCKSRLRILHVHSDGRSLSWKPAVGEPTSSKRPPKLDLSTCIEVRHAWSPDPQNPVFTGTPILRQKCEAANAHKSFALIFPKRTVDITAVTADQCKVLMEGFSALCFRLQVASLAGKSAKKGTPADKDESELSTTASNTLTNNSAQISPSGSGAGARSKKRALRTDGKK